MGLDIQGWSLIGETGQGHNSIVFICRFVAPSRVLKGIIGDHKKFVQILLNERRVASAGTWPH